MFIYTLKYFYPETEYFSFETFHFREISNGLKHFISLYNDIHKRINDIFKIVQFVYKFFEFAMSSIIYNISIILWNLSEGLISKEVKTRG